MTEEAWINCPFCDGTAHRQSQQVGGRNVWHFIECQDCGATAEPDVWNERAAQVTYKGMKIKGSAKLELQNGAVYRVLFDGVNMVLINKDEELCGL